MAVDRTQALEAAKRRSLAAAGIHEGSPQTSAGSMQQSYAGQTSTQTETAQTPGAPLPAPGQNHESTDTHPPAPTPIVSPSSAAAEEDVQPGYRSVGVVLYDNHVAVMDEMTAFCKTAGVKGIRKGANTSLFVGAALDRLCEVFRNDPTQFKEMVTRRIQTLKESS